MELLIIGLFLTLFTLEFIVEFALNELNLRHVRARFEERSVPEFFRHKINPEEYDRSVRYTLAKGRFHRWAEIYGRIVTLVVLFAGVLPYLERVSTDVANRVFPSIWGEGSLVCFAVGLLLSLASLPADLVGTFGL
jgi:STE24 endopeptidase